MSLATGMFLLAGVIGIFSSTLTSQAEGLKATRLNQDLRNIMDLMARDVRRAGYWQLAYATGEPAGNLVLSGTSGSITVTNSRTSFSTLGSNLVGRTLISDFGAATITSYDSSTSISATVTRTFTRTNLNEGQWMISNLFSETANDVTLSADGTCLQYAYDRNGDSTVDANERFAFRKNGTAIEMYAGSGTAPNCSTGAGSWETVSGDTIEITGLTFSTSAAQCLNLSTGVTSCTTPTPTSGNVLLTLREVDITLTGRLAANTAVTRTLTENVRLRNDRITVY